jgi:hypothetical protein
MSFYTGLLLSPLRTKLGPSRIALAGLMLLSQVAYAFGYYLERMGGPRSGPALEPTATPADDGQVPDAPELETRRGNGMASGR